MEIKNMNPYLQNYDIHKLNNRRLPTKIKWYRLRKFGKNIVNIYQWFMNIFKHKPPPQ